MGLLMYSARQKREQEKKAQEQAQPTRNTLRDDPTAASRSPIRRQQTIRRHDNPVSERRNGRASPRSVRLSLRNGNIAERDRGDWHFAVTPGLRAGNNQPEGRSTSQSRRAQQAEAEDRYWQTTGQTGSAQTFAEMVAAERHIPSRELRRLLNSHERHGYAALQNAIRERRNRDHYLPSSRALLNELEEMRSVGLNNLDDETRRRRAQAIDEQRRRVLHLEGLRSEERAGSLIRLRSPNAGRNAPRGSQVRQVPAYDDLTTDSRQALDRLMGSVPRVDGLGDRERSPIWHEDTQDAMSSSDSEGEVDAWDTLLTTITPDDRLPSNESSFNTAAAESMSATMSGSSLRRSTSSSRSRETAETEPSLANLPMPSGPNIERLLSPGCEDDETGMATPNSLPELVRVQRVRSPASSVRPEHVQPQSAALSPRPDRVEAITGQSSQLLDLMMEDRNRDLDGAGSPVLDGPIDGPIDGPVGANAESGERSFDSARRDIEREIEDFRRSRMQGLLEDFMARGNSEDIPDEVWQSFVPRNVLAGAAGEANPRT